MTVTFIQSDETMELGKNFLIQVFTGSGMAGVIAAKHIISEEGLQEVGYLDADLTPPLAVVIDGIAENPVKVYTDGVYTIVVNQAIVPSRWVKPFVRELFSWYESEGFRRVYVLGGFPTGRKIDIDFTDIHFASSDEETDLFLQSKGVEAMSRGFIYGSIAESLLSGGRRGISTVAIVANCIAQITDFLAAKTLVEGLSRLIDIDISVEALNFKSSELKRQLIQRGFDDDEYFGDVDDSMDPSKFV